jgi:hypothetical protein
MQRMLNMTRLWITEHVNEDGAAIGPYIKADTVAEANRIAIQYGLLVLGEIQELQHDIQLEERKVH